MHLQIVRKVLLHAYLIQFVELDCESGFVFPNTKKNEQSNFFFFIFEKASTVNVSLLN